MKILARIAGAIVGLVIILGVAAIVVGGIIWLVMAIWGAIL